MKSRLSHIFRSCTIALLLAGFAAHIAVPFFGDVQKNAFTQWLDHKVVAGGNDLSDELRDRIRELPKEAGDFWMLVQDASKLISEHEENFQIAPFTSKQQHEQVSTWLIGQWSTFKHQQNNANAILPKIFAPVHKWLTQVTSFHASFPEPATLHTPNFRSTVLSVPHVMLSLFPPPSSGISINAP
jgi:hypothetical protein